MPTAVEYPKLNRLVQIISIALPLIVAVLFQVKLPNFLPFSPYWLPSINAFLNGSTAAVLIMALFAIKGGKVQLHSRLIYFAMFLSVLFLLGYVLYHITTEHTKYAGEWTKTYYSLLISHILLAAIQAPLVLYAFLYGFTGQWDKHKKMVKLAFPVWLYVSVTGVICYKLIAPFYPVAG